MPRCGYLAAYSVLLALYARERRGDGVGDWAETSLCNAATLIQLLLQRPGSEPPPSARGQLATGMTPGARVYQLSDGWIFAQAPRDITAELGTRSRSDALAWSVKLVGEHTEEWLAKLRDAMSAVDDLRAEGPEL